MRGSLTDGTVFTPQEFALMASLPNFQGARLVSPDGAVLSMMVRKGEAFTPSEAALLNERLHILANTKALTPFQKLRAALGQLDRVRMGAKISSVVLLNRSPGTIRPSPRRMAAA